MPRVIVEVSGGVARVESSSDEVDVLFFDYDELVERCGEEGCAAIRDALDNGKPEKAQRLVDSIYNGEQQWPEEVGR